MPKEWRYILASGDFMKNWQVIGHHSIRESLLLRAHEAQELLIRENYKASKDLSELVRIAEKNSVFIKTMGDKKLNQAQPGHQGAILLTKPVSAPDWDSIYAKDKSLVLVLDGIEDPHNLGAILRTSWLMGADALVIPKDRSVKLTATALKIASGGAEHVPIEVVTNLGRSLADLKENSYWVSGLAEGGSDTLYKWEAEEKAAIVVGAEDTGIRKSTREACDRIIEIWQVEGGSSYNASIAASLAMSQYRRCFS